MKKTLLGLAVIGLLAGCSADPDTLKRANDSYQKSADKPAFTGLATGGVTILNQASTYDLPKIEAKQTAEPDIRPPTTPLALIQHSLTQFDGERSLIVYADSQAELYNLNQIARLLKEEGIHSSVNSAILTTDWAKTGRVNDGDNEIRYQIEQVSAQNASALAVSVLQMRRDDIIFTPTLSDKQRYTADRLNRLISALSQAYAKQQQELNNLPTGNVESAPFTDRNGHTALAMNAGFKQAWEKLGSVLPKLGFGIKNETKGRGHRELKYSALDDDELQALGIARRPDLENGTYFMQISVLGKQSAVVFSDENGKALPAPQATALYQALGQLLAK